MPIEVKHPTVCNRDDRPNGGRDRRVPGLFISAVRIRDEPDIVGIVATLDAPPREQKAIPGTAAWMYTDGDGNRYYFTLFGDDERRISSGVHTLYLSKVNAQNGIELVKQVQFESNGLWGEKFIEFEYPAPNADISDERDYFVAYGPLSHDAVSVWLAEGGRTILAESLFSSLSNSFWIAVFPSLDSGSHNYVLNALDSNVDTATPRNISTM
ncbi:hypothetical protein GobsT_54180 [Gemmata obscuriglobus]|uniref:hypothetical protein n=1 Tax=Gemmata obscuriglobus TaxID=114 RepID=UPI0011CCEDA7|nr:hypothetical protein [Gemmata obscuriglobus]QEG30613.1 hypothetical protein GobsT_54180 [Gemmata obscuriglobus]VTS09937.1 unnamed protein product [Gemmata obscuriglobus UQM 2246]